jgi:hypothetical protein
MKRIEPGPMLFLTSAAVRPTLQPVGTENPEDEDGEYNQKLGCFTNCSKYHRLVAFPYRSQLTR